LVLAVDSNDNSKIVVFKGDKDHAEKDKILKKHGAVKVEDIKETDAVVIRVSSENSLSKDPGIEYIEDDAIVSISKVKEERQAKKPKSKDIQEAEQPEEIIPWGIQYVGAPQMWNTECGEGLKVAVVDIGGDIDHPDLVDNIMGGVVLEADLYAVKALDSYVHGYVSYIVEGIQWCLENDIDIINMSFGLTVDSQLLHESTIEASNVGVEMVAAAGNNYGGECEYPAAYDEVVGVGAIDANRSIANFSAIDGVDAWAPGVQIYSTYIDSDYKNLDGT